VHAETQLLQSFVFLPAKKTPVSAQPKSNQKEGDPGLPRHLAGGVPFIQKQELQLRCFV
jgi:hypothetical protein